MAPLENVVRPEGHVTQGKMRRVTPLEHLVHPEGHVALLTNKRINLDDLRTNNVIRKI